MSFTGKWVEMDIMLRKINQIESCITWFSNVETRKTVDLESIIVITRHWKVYRGWMSVEQRWLDMISVLSMHYVEILHGIPLI